MLVTEEQLLEAITDSRGIVDNIRKRLGISWETASNYIKANPEASKLLASERERVKDSCENLLIDKIEGGDEATAKWWLARMAKERGFGESLAVEATGSMPASITEQIEKIKQKYASKGS